MKIQKGLFVPHWIGGPRSFAQVVRAPHLKQHPSKFDINLAWSSVKPGSAGIPVMHAKVYMPNYIKLVHWLYEENRMVALTEAAKFMNVTLNGIQHYIKAILKYEDIFKVRICQLENVERKQYAIRVLAIRPYKLISGRGPILEENVWHCFQGGCYSMTDIWRELICKPWCKMYISISV